MIKWSVVVDKEKGMVDVGRESVKINRQPGQYVSLEDGGKICAAWYDTDVCSKDTEVARVKSLFACAWDKARLSSDFGFAWFEFGDSVLFEYPWKIEKVPEGLFTGTYTEAFDRFIPRIISQFRPITKQGFTLKSLFKGK